MKKISLLFAFLMAFAVSAMAQSTLPIPGDPSIDEWIDYTGGWFTPSLNPDTLVWVEGSSQIGFMLAQTVMTMEPVDNRYSLEKEFDVDSAYYQDYTVLDKDKVTYSVFTDFDEIFEFTPEEFPNEDLYGLTLPATEIPFNYQGRNFGWCEIHFNHRSNTTEGQDHFFDWRIGIRMNYRDGDQETHSNIVYWEICDKPVSLLGDVDDNGVVEIADVTALIDYLLVGLPVNKFNADVSNDNMLDISDLTELIDMILLGNV
jgi:hypothetical protein